MINLAIIYHMHQPYYKDLLTQETPVPWVRLHGIKDYLDMVEMLNDYPAIRLTVNLVPSLMEQVEDYVNRTVSDTFLRLSYKPAHELSADEQDFISRNFFMINRERVISLFPRYLELYFKCLRNARLNLQDYLDLQVWFNLAWFDPGFRSRVPELKQAVEKARFFSEEDKRAILDVQPEILKKILPAYRDLMSEGRIEVTTTPYYHPILPLLYSTRIAKEAYNRSILPKTQFSWPQDVAGQIEGSVRYYQGRFGSAPSGMWPSEESVCEHIVPFLIQAGINWIVTDEAILFKSLKKKRRDTRLLYRPHILRRKDGNLAIVFRDRNLSDLIGFEYFKWKAQDAAADFIKHLSNINEAFRGEDVLVTIALDGENAWEYYPNDGHDFLHAFYGRLSEAGFLRTVTVSEYLKKAPPTSQIKRLAAGSWIFGDFGKWIGNPHKTKAWEWLAVARQALADFEMMSPARERLELAYKQMYICEGSDWFWWYGEDPDGSFDRLYRMHLSNLYRIMERPIPAYLNTSLVP